MVVDWGSSDELRKWIDLLNYVKAKFSWFIFSLNMAHQRKNTEHKWNILGLIKGKDRSDICWDGKEQGFPRGSAGKESTWNAGDPGSIPGLGRSPGEGIGYPLQYSCPSLEAQLVKNPLAMQEIWVQSLGWEDPLEEGMATHSGILAWRITWTEEPGGLQSMRSRRVGHDWATKHSTAEEHLKKYLVFSKR